METRVTVHPTLTLDEAYRVRDAIRSRIVALGYIRAIEAAEARAASRERNPDP